MAEIPVILLAAGGSTRMGQPKQLLPWGTETLIEHQILTLQKAGQPVVVILGSNSNLVMPFVEKYPVTILVNPNWESGMGSSISYGIVQVKHRFPNAKGVLITLLDQPLITTAYIEEMIGVFQPGSQQILVSYSSSGWTGVPVLFDACYFSELMELKNDEGAKKIIQQHKENLALIEGGELLEDMDTPEAYRNMLGRDRIK